MRCGFGPPRIIELRFSSTCVSLQSTRELTLVHRVVVLRDIVLSCRVAKDRYCRLCVNQDGEHGAGGNGSDCVVVFGSPRIIELRFSSTCVSLQSTRGLTLGSSGCRVARHCSEQSSGERRLLSALRQSRMNLIALWDLAAKDHRTALFVNL